MSQSISIPRTGNSALTFTGKLIDRFAAASLDSSYLNSAPVDDVRRLLEIYLYQADSGKHVVWVIYRSEPGGRLQRSYAYLGDTSEDLVQQLRRHDYMHAVADLRAVHEADQGLWERELRAQWENVVELIEWSIQDREGTLQTPISAHDAEPSPPA